MRLTGPMQAMGCLTSLVTLGGFVGGIYHGIADSKGIGMGNGLETMVKWAPATINGLFGLSLGPMTAEANSEEMAYKIKAQNPYIDMESARNFSKAGLTLSGPVAGFGMTAGFCYLGYIIGNSIGNNI